MLNDGDYEYFRTREAEERARAEAARHALVRRAHIDLARRYAQLHAPASAQRGEGGDGAGRR